MGSRSSFVLVASEVSFSIRRTASKENAWHVVQAAQDGLTQLAQCKEHVGPSHETELLATGRVILLYMICLGKLE
jgi:hypothetical protein